MKKKKKTKVDEAITAAANGAGKTYPINEALHRRLNKVIGQCNGILRMLGRKAQCEDVLLQVSAAKNALHRVGQLILESYLRTCFEDGVKTKDVGSATQRYTCAIDCFCRGGAPIAKDGCAPTDGETLETRLDETIKLCNAIILLIDRQTQCEDILLQVSAAKNLLHRVGQLILEGHLKTCLEKGIKSEDAEDAIRRYDRAIEYFCRQSK